MATIRDITSRILAYRTAQRMTRAGMAVAAGLHRDALRQMDNPNWNPTAETLRKLEAVIPPDWMPPAAAAAAQEAA